MPTAPADPPTPRRRRSLVVATAAGASALAIAAALGVAWLERGRVAAHLAESYLAQRGVSAAIAFETVSPSRLVGRAVLGPTDDPDATVERFEVALAGGGLGLPRVRAVRLLRPTLKVRFDGRRLDFGRLQRLVDELQRAPAGGPSPDLTIQGGLVRLITPGGEARVGLDADMRAGRLITARARVGQGEVGFGTLHVRLSAGQASVDRDAHGVLTARFDLAGPEVVEAGARAQDLHALGEVELARSAADRLAGPLRGEVTIETGDVRAGAARAHQARLVLDVDGALVEDGGRFRGAGHVRLDADAARGPAVSAASLQLAGDLSNLVIAPDAGGVGVSGHAALHGAADRLALGATRAPAAEARLEAAAVQGRIGQGGGALSLTPKLSFVAARVEAPAGALTGVQAAAQAGRAALSWGRGGWRFAAPLDLHLTADGAAVPKREVSAHAVRADLSGRGAIGAAGVRLSLAGAAGGDLAAAPAEARRFAGAVPILASDPAFQAAAVAAARRVSVRAPRLAVALGPSGWSLRLPAVVEARSASGATLALDARDPHAASLSLAGGGLPELKAEVARYDLGRDAGGVTLQANGRLQLAYAGRELDQARLQLAFDASRRRGVLAVALPECGELALGRFGARATPLVTGLSTRACPAGAGPALSLGDDGWRLAARLEGLGFHAPSSQADVSKATVDLALRSGPRGAAVGEAAIVAARLADAAPMRRFEPLAATGRLALADGLWRGPLALSDAAGARPVATVEVRHDLAAGVGHADIAAPHLAFARGGLQPKDLTPVGADLVSEVEGEVAFSGVADWGPAGLTSGGRFTTSGLAFTSPFGRVQGASADIRLTSLAPLISAPAQPVAAASIDWILPLTAATASVGLTADAIRVAAAQATVSGGAVKLDPVTLPYDQAHGVSGVVRLDNLDLAALFDRFNLGDKIMIQAKVSGALPFSTQGGALRFAGGRLFATGPGRLSIRPEALTSATASAGGPPDANLQGFALQALQDLAFDRLEADVDSRPMGRLGVLFHISGRHDPPKGGEVHVGLLDLLRGRALQDVKDLPKGTEVNLTLDTSLNFDELLAAYAAETRSEPVQSAADKP